MRANRIFIALLALFFCAAEFHIERAARQDPQPGKPASQPSNIQSPGGSPEQKPGGQYRLPMPDTELVSLSVTVTDNLNRLVSGLDRRHFEIYEDKVKQEISFFSDADAPVNMGIVFDVSGSMKGKLDRARDALKAFIQTSHSDDDFFLVAFNQRVPGAVELAFHASRNVE